MIIYLADSRRLYCVWIQTTSLLVGVIAIVGNECTKQLTNQWVHVENPKQSKRDRCLVSENLQNPKPEILKTTSFFFPAPCHLLYKMKSSRRGFNSQRRERITNRQPPATDGIVLVLLRHEPVPVSASQIDTEAQGKYT